MCRAVAQMEPGFFSADLTSGAEMEVLRAIACGRNTLSDRMWEGLDAAARREAERDFPADASGGRSPRAEERFEARLRAERARLFREGREREVARLQVFEAGAAALKTAYYSLSAGERAALVAEVFGASGVPDLFTSVERWTIG